MQTSPREADGFSWTHTPSLSSSDQFISVWEGFTIISESRTRWVLLLLLLLSAALIKPTETRASLHMKPPRSSCVGVCLCSCGHVTALYHRAANRKQLLCFIKVWGHFFFPLKEPSIDDQLASAVSQLIKVSKHYRNCILSDVKY